MSFSVFIRFLVSRQDRQIILKRVSLNCHFGSKEIGVVLSDVGG
jgi:hypothetical protein